MNGERIYYVTDKNTKHIREKIVTTLRDLPNAPVIKVAKSNFNKDGELLLFHDFDEDKKDVDVLHLVKTLEHIYYLWGSPVWFQTRELSTKSSSGFITVLYGYGPNGVRKTQI